MRAIACRELGNDCSWKQTARTEELLTDEVAIHLRDVHGIMALTPELIGRVKNAFSGMEPVEIPEDKKEEPVLKEFFCKDLGMDCGFRYIAQTEELIADGIAVHAREAHGIQEFTTEMAAAVKNRTHPWKG
jgi:predicted small metal-binding protein